MDFAVIENNKVVNIVVANAIEDIAFLGEVAILEEGFGIGDLYENGTFKHDESKLLQQQLNQKENELKEVNEQITELMVNDYVQQRTEAAAISLAEEGQESQTVEDTTAIDNEKEIMNLIQRRKTLMTDIAALKKQLETK